MLPARHTLSPAVAVPSLKPAIRRLPRRNHVASLVALILVFAGCRGSEPSLTEYVEVINAASADAIERAETIMAEGALGGDDVTPQQVQAVVLRTVEEIRVPLQNAVEDAEPPGQIAPLHALLWDWHAELIETERALADRIGAVPNTAAGWTALSDSTEVAAYRASLAEGKQVCLDFQTELDATEARGAFDGVAWVPSEFREVVVAALGCEFFPEDPATVYQFPPP